MSLLHIEGWGGVGDSVAEYKEYVRSKYYGILGNLEVEDGRKSGHSMKLVNGSSVIFPNMGGTDVLFYGFAFKTSAIPGANYSIARHFQVELNSELQHTQLVLTTAGEIGLAAQTGTTPIATAETSGLDIQAEEWYYIEVKILMSSSAGTGEFILYVNGVEEVNVNVRTQYGFSPSAPRLDHVSFISTGALGPRLSFDDIYFLDDAGSAPHNTFLGNCQVTTIYPEAAGDDSDFTPLSGDNYANVDDGESIDESTYVESSTSTNQDLYDYEDVAIPTTIFGLQVNTDAVYSGTDMHQLENTVKSDTTTNQAAARRVESDKYVALSDIWEQDPDAAAAWTQSTINAAQFGMEVT